MNEVKIEQSNTLDYVELPLFQKQVSDELQSNLNKIINEEVSKYSKKMTETTIAVCNEKMFKCKSFTEKLQQELYDKEARINNLNVEKQSLKNQLTSCFSQIENQKKQISNQEDVLAKKLRRIEILEKENAEASRLIDNERKNIATLEHVRAHEVKSFGKVTADFERKIAAAEKSIKHWKHQACSEVNRCIDTMKERDTFHSLYLKEVGQHMDLMAKCEKLEQINKMKITAETKTLKNNEYELLLDQKESTIQEYLKIINARDTQLSFQKLCCPVCISDIDENKQWVAFHPCGHQTCSECFIDLPPASRDSKRCPICYMLISIGVLLAKE